MKEVLIVLVVVGLALVAAPFIGTSQQVARSEYQIQQEKTRLLQILSEKNRRDEESPRRRLESSSVAGRWRSASVGTIEELCC